VSGNDSDSSGRLFVRPSRPPVMLHCPAGLARKATPLIFSQPEEVVSVNDVQNAIGEITNMIGGNIKALLSEPPSPSLPAMVCTAVSRVLQVT
jgi:Chemotaxis phosphatase CheX